MSHYILPLIGAVAIAITALCVYSDYRNNYMFITPKK